MADDNNNSARPENGNGRKLPLWTQLLLSGLVLPIIVVSISHNPGIAQGTAYSFLQHYYTDVVASRSERVNLYDKDLTDNFKQSVELHFKNFNQYWRGQNAPRVDWVNAVPSNPTQFTVQMTYHPKAGAPITETQTYSLVCTGFWYYLAHTPLLSCEQSGLKIDFVSKQTVSS